MNEAEDQLVELTTRPNELDAGLVCEVLRSGGVACTTRQADGAALGIFGASSFNPIAVLVRAGDLPAARRLLENRRSESVDIDWSEVDVGEPADDIARRIAARDGVGSARAGDGSGAGRGGRGLGGDDAGADVFGESPARRRERRAGAAVFVAMALVVLVAGLTGGPVGLIVALAGVSVVAAVRVFRA